MKLDFFKMQAQGNDYIYFDFIDKPLPEIDLSKLAIKLSKRNFSIGSDGIVLILNSNTCDCKMRMFNADGSEGTMCGSALRCVCFFLSQQIGKSRITVETLAGNKTGLIKNEKERLVTTDLGVPEFIKNEKIAINNHEGYLISVGNPHYVTFMTSLSENIARYQGHIIDNPAYFPEGINVEFVKVINKNEIEIKVWERGSGATLACGTGACAASFCGIKKGFLSSEIKVHMPGGSVFVELKEDNIFLTGKVDYVFDGSVEI
ncbi:MAG: diaminopimelate epimerase [Candidatus Cloacimonetes bacterium]|nr:diaminopimelate epimerase [Candidatus Cloacimonadota bacterium]MBT5419847.1 diaminopimelate epimerase [Candidatus Cloacimonadota bacterium]